MKELKYILSAHKLNTDYQAVLLKHKLHFRGNVKSISLVSLAKETPQLGISNIKTEQTALNWLGKIINKEKQFTLGRTTREKELQAWLIHYALTNNNKLYFDNQLAFITSELALYENKTRIVNDILAIDEEENLVVIELKSTRDKKRIELQVANFIAIINKNKPFFTSLVKAITNRNWNGKTKGIVVWNDSGKMKRVINNAYREICYFEKGTKGKRLIDYDANNNIQFKEIA
ncbi:MAG: hypothetical protein IPL84_02815 [Chitinophagaceae bacterium]|nr:hypothetical protein [Chitinophagaceae bacterium]